MGVKRPAMPREIRETVAFSQGWRCNECEEMLCPCFQIDHVVPWCIQQDNSIQNLQALCANCHAIKSSREARKIRRVRIKQLSLGTKLCWWCEKPNVADGKTVHGRGMCDVSTKTEVEPERPIGVPEPISEDMKDTVADMVEIDLSGFLYKPPTS